MIVIIFLMIIVLKLVGVISSKQQEFLNPATEPDKSSPTIASNPQTSPTVLPEAEDMRIRDASAESIIYEIENLYKDKSGQYGWYFQSLASDEGYGSNYDFSYTAASINKIPIMMSFLQSIENGEMNLDDEYALNSLDIEGGSGTLQYQKLGSRWQYQQLLEFSGHYSDNTAINAMHRLSGYGSAQKLVNSFEMPLTDINKNTTSPREMTGFLSGIYQQKVLKSQELRDLFYQSLQNTEYEEDLIPDGIPAHIAVSHKIGWQIQVWSDCGIIFSQNPYALCILTDKINEAQAREILPQISRKIWFYEGD